MKINSFLLSVCAGAQTYSFKRLVLDFYAGAGYKISSKTSHYDGYRHYDQEDISFAYKGFTILTGIKAGFKIK